MGTGVINVEHSDGYRARVSVTWHKPVPVTRDQLFASCRAKANHMLGSDSSQDVINVITAKVTTEFLTTDGFEWPKEGMVKTIGAHHTGGFSSLKTSSSVCGSAGKFGNNFHWNVAMTPPAGGTVTLMFMEASRKTPKNPTGKGKFPREWYRVSASGIWSNESCTGYGAVSSKSGRHCSIYFER